MRKQKRKIWNFSLCVVENNDPKDKAVYLYSRIVYIVVLKQFWFKTVDFNYSAPYFSSGSLFKYIIKM